MEVMYKSQCGTITYYYKMYYNNCVEYTIENYEFECNCVAPKGKTRQLHVRLSDI